MANIVHSSRGKNKLMNGEFFKEQCNKWRDSNPNYKPGKGSGRRTSVNSAGWRDHYDDIFRKKKLSKKDRADKQQEQPNE